MVCSLFKSAVQTNADKYCKAVHKKKKKEATLDTEVLLCNEIKSEDSKKTVTPDRLNENI